LEKFREFRAFMKKIRRAAGRNEKEEAARQHAMAPTYTLHHLVRERYPRFSDALNDMDDALTLVHLFASLPSEKDIRAKVVNKAKALVGSWAAYCATTSAITKSFISVKGVYLEASIQGSIIRWVVPHAFTQSMPEEVDYKVMLTFFEFYETLLSFVLFKLYNNLGVRYPLPVKDLSGEATGSTSSVIATNLKAMMSALNPNSNAVSDLISESLEKVPVEKEEKKSSKESRELIKSVGTALTKLIDEEDDEDDDEDDADVAGPLRAALDTMTENDKPPSEPKSFVVADSLDDDATKRRNLFGGLTFFLSREVPRGYLELVCLCYGGRVGWEGPNSPVAISDPSITHHIVDRPKLPTNYNGLTKSREFLQPQWIIDCANSMFLLPVARYGVGKTLPPHLSPWVDDEEEAYKPAYAEEIEKLKNGESIAANIREELDDIATPRLFDEKREEDKDNKIQKDNEDEEDEDDGDEDEDEAKVPENNDSVDREARDLAKVMMSKKASRLYGRMQHGIAERQAKAEALCKKRKEIEGKKKNEDGKTVLKQKVERLKKERKNIEDEYSRTSGSMKKKRV
jgi:pescadillo protein